MPKKVLQSDETTTNIFGWHTNHQTNTESVHFHLVKHGGGGSIIPWGYFHLPRHSMFSLYFMIVLCFMLVDRINPNKIDKSLSFAKS